MTAPKVLVSMATYNEKDNLEPLIREIQQTVPDVHLLVIDDNSPDGTGKLADDLAAKDPRIHVVHRAGKLGLGTAILAGMNYAIEHGYDYFVNVDADYSHHPRYLPAILEMAKDKDVVIGSRYVPGGGTLNWPWKRRMMSSGVNFMTRVLMRLPARDTSGGYRCYRVSLLKETNLDNLMSKGYSFQQEVLLRCKLAGARIGESPIIFEERRAGATKVNVKEVVRSLWTIFWVGTKSTFGFVPGKKTA